MTNIESIKKVLGTRFTNEVVLSYVEDGEDVSSLTLWLSMSDSGFLYGEMQGEYVNGGDIDIQESTDGPEEFLVYQGTRTFVNDVSKVQDILSEFFGIPVTLTVIV